MFWLIVTLVCVVVFIAALWWADSVNVDNQASDEELVQAAVELHRIGQQLEVAWTRHELKDEANRLRRELDAELRRIDVLESGKREE